MLVPLILTGNLGAIGVDRRDTPRKGAWPVSLSPRRDALLPGSAMTGGGTIPGETTGKAEASTKTEVPPGTKEEATRDTSQETSTGMNEEGQGAENKPTGRTATSRGGTHPTGTGGARPAGTRTTEAIPTGDLLEAEVEATRGTTMTIKVVVDRSTLEEEEAVAEGLTGATAGGIETTRGGETTRRDGLWNGANPRASLRSTTSIRMRT